MVRAVPCGLETSQEEHSPHQRLVLDVGLGNGKVVKHGFARNSTAHQLLTHVKPKAGRWLNSERGVLGDPLKVKGV